MAHSLIAVVKYKNACLDPFALNGLADEAHIGRVVLDKQNQLSPHFLRPDSGMSVVTRVTPRSSPETESHCPFSTG